MTYLEVKLSALETRLHRMKAKKKMQVQKERLNAKYEILKSRLQN